MKSSVRTQPCSNAQSAKKPLRLRVSPPTLRDAILKTTTKTKQKTKTIANRLKTYRKNEMTARTVGEKYRKTGLIADRWTERS